MAMACKSKTRKDLPVSHGVVAVHQQLHDEDDDHHQKKKGERITGEEEVDQSRSLSDATCAKIHEIFGNDEVVRPKKQTKKYRLLQSVYMATMPIIAEADKGRRIINVNVM